ncbi:hypothetical protein L3V82_04260 [Thiotrichales bacterium 19S3-7]|nr:hypothetical protein [Thiotrichales bacterium 19S3-7]MCF6802685.1 hypothetical protein [Thiotrichales bacterium 19S3-11]
MVKNMDSVYSLYKKLQNYNTLNSNKSIPSLSLLSSGYITDFKITPKEYTVSQQLGLGLSRISSSNACGPIKIKNIDDIISKLENKIRGYEKNTFAKKDYKSSKMDKTIPPQVIYNTYQHIDTTNNCNSQQNP